MWYFLHIKWLLEDVNQNSVTALWKSLSNFPRGRQRNAVDRILHLVRLLSDLDVMVMDWLHICSVILSAKCSLANDLKCKANKMTGAGRDLRDSWVYLTYCTDEEVRMSDLASLAQLVGLEGTLGLLALDFTLSRSSFIAHVCRKKYFWSLFWTYFEVSSVSNFAWLWFT